jgi:hypothetical protein
MCSFKYWPSGLEFALRASHSLGRQALQHMSHSAGLFMLGGSEIRACFVFLPQAALYCDPLALG